MALMDHRERIGSLFIYKLTFAAFVSLVVSIAATTAKAQQFSIGAPSVPAPPPSKLSLEQAVEEAVQNNLGLLADRMNINLAEANLITAKLRPNPVVSISADHLDLLGTGFSDSNGGGPSEFVWRGAVHYEAGGGK